MTNGWMYFIDFEQFGIKDDGTDATSTTNGFVAAFKRAVELGHSAVYVPEGTYLIDAVGVGDYLPEYGGGLQFPSNIEVILHEKALFKVQPNDSTGYACFNLEGVENVTIRGGHIIGDRYEHNYRQDVNENRRTHEWGFGIQVRGSKNVTIENVTIEDCTGDNIWVTSKGMMNWPGVYIPSESVTIRKCRTSRGRRNNIAAGASVGLLIDDCDIIEAGGDEIGPQLGIDLEGYADNSIKYQHPYEINVINCRFKDNGRGSMNINVSGKVNAIGNFCDDYIGYGFSTDVTISNNVITNETGVHKKFGIDSIRKSTSETANRAVITGNVIRGFQTGIAARGKTVTVSNNILEDISSIGIYPYLCDQAVVSSNIIDSNCLHIWVRESKDIKVSDNKGIGAASSVSIKVDASKGVLLSDNEVSGKGGVRVSRSTNVRVIDNDIDLIGSDYGIYFDKQSEVHLRDNLIKNAAFTAIMGYADQYSSYIKGNIIQDCKYMIAMHIDGGSKHMIKDNDITFRRGSNAGYGVYLIGANDSRLHNNDIRVMDGFVLINSFYTIQSTNTKLIGNTYDTGEMKTNDTDFLRYNEKLPK